MTSKRFEKRADAAPPHKRHDHVNGVRRVDLRANLVPERRLPARVRQERRIEERRQRCVERLWGPIGLAPQDRRQHSCGIEGQIDLSVDRVAHLREQFDKPRDDLRAGLGATVLGQRLDRTRYDHREVARQAVGRLRVGEGS